MQKCVCSALALLPHIRQSLDTINIGNLCKKGIFTLEDSSQVNTSLYAVTFFNNITLKSIILTSDLHVALLALSLSTPSANKLNPLFSSKIFQQQVHTPIRHIASSDKRPCRKKNQRKSILSKSSACKRSLSREVDEIHLRTYTAISNSCQTAQSKLP